MYELIPPCKFTKTIRGHAERASETLIRKLLKNLPSCKEIDEDIDVVK